MQDLGYNENDDDADDDYDNHQTRARQLLIDTTRKNLEKSVKKAELDKHDASIVSGSAIFSLVTAQGDMAFRRLPRTTRRSSRTKHSQELMLTAQVTNH